MRKAGEFEKGTVITTVSFSLALGALGVWMGVGDTYFGSGAAVLFGVAGFVAGAVIGLVVSLIVGVMLSTIGWVARGKPPTSDKGRS